MTAELRVVVAALIGLALWLWWSAAPGGAPGEDPDALGDEERASPEPAAGERSRVGPAEVATTCDLLALALSAGGGLDESVDAVGRVSPPGVGEVLAMLVAGRRWGVPAQVTHDALPRVWAPMLAALRLAEEAGIPPSGPLRHASADLRRGRSHRLEVATARLRVLMVLPLALCFLPAFVLTTIVPVVLALAVRVTAP